MSMRWSDEELAEKLKNPDLKVKQENPLPRLSPLLAKEHKYRVANKEDRTYNGIVYHSKKEAEFASRLDLLKKAGDIDFWLRQVPFPLPGGSEYRIDFVTFKLLTNLNLFEIHWKEVKGYKTSMGELKRKQAEAIYGINIEVV